MRGRWPKGHRSIRDVKPALPPISAAQAPLTSLMLGLGMLNDGALGPLTDTQREVVRAMVADLARVSLLIEKESRIEGLLSDAEFPPTTAVELASRSPPVPRDPRGATIVVQTQDGAVIVVDAVRLLWMAAGLLDKTLRHPPTGGSLVTAIQSTSENASTLETSLATPATTPKRDPPSGSGLVRATPEIVLPQRAVFHTPAADAGGATRVSAPASGSQRADADRPHLRICTVVASFVGFRAEHATSSRLVVAFEVLSWAIARAPPWWRSRRLPSRPLRAGRRRPRSCAWAGFRSGARGDRDPRRSRRLPARLGGHLLTGLHRIRRCSALLCRGEVRTCIIHRHLSATLDDQHQLEDGAWCAE